ncbi:hypothetical protein BDA96_04G193600 [Sorghum bicolor]|uniref:Uncharacterized protein n=1 Tax=Sorghum bicolor TaxID=4558 RepID=A0A921R3Q2_SORBI|nr:hypothetical protein BDA96_04G193600 [Sorghum bicolor]
MSEGECTRVGHRNLQGHLGLLPATRGRCSPSTAPPLSRRCGAATTCWTAHAGLLRPTSPVG